MGTVGKPIEVLEFVTRKSVEDAYREARRAQMMGRESLALVGMRAARARDPKLLKALEGGARIMRGLSEEQFGQHGIDVGGIYVKATEYQLWQKAYEFADRGEALEHLQWIYGAAAILAGLY
jgi:hypothetical protein